MSNKPRGFHGRGKGNGKNRRTQDAERDIFSDRFAHHPTRRPRDGGKTRGAYDG